MANDSIYLSFCLFSLINLYDFLIQRKSSEAYDLWSII